MICKRTSFLLAVQVTVLKARFQCVRCAEERKADCPHPALTLPKRCAHKQSQSFCSLSPSMHIYTCKLSPCLYTYISVYLYTHVLNYKGRRLLCKCKYMVRTPRGAWRFLGGRSVEYTTQASEFGNLSNMPKRSFPVLFWVQEHAAPPSRLLFSFSDSDGRISIADACRNPMLLRWQRRTHLHRGCFWDPTLLTNLHRRCL